MSCSTLDTEFLFAPQVTPNQVWVGTSDGMIIAFDISAHCQMSAYPLDSKSTFRHGRVSGNRFTPRSVSSICSTWKNPRDSIFVFSGSLDHSLRRFTINTNSKELRQRRFRENGLFSGKNFSIIRWKRETLRAANGIQPVS